MRARWFRPGYHSIFSHKIKYLSLSRLPRNTVEEALIPIRVSVVLIEDGRILLANHIENDEPFWTLPGGRLKTGETVTQAAVRELKEETGLDIETGDLLFVDEAISDGHTIPGLQLIFRGETVGGAFHPTLEEGYLGAEFIEIEQLTEINFFPHVIAEEIASAHASGSRLAPKFIQRQY